MKTYRIKPDTQVDLDAWDPKDKSQCPGGKDEAKARFKDLNAELERLQELLYAEGRQKVLVVLQATDTGGKDGTIRHVFDGVNPQGVKVASFGKPTEEELDHDYLWRVHRHVPKRGQMTIFNRSHYEDVLIVRVHNLVPEEVWSRRYAHINAFEKMLADEGTTILKFFLHIDLEEQEERLRERLERPEKHWKFNPADLKERMRWYAYRRAYEAMLSRTSTAWAPWYVVPANRKWYRNLVVAQTLVDRLRDLNMKPPAADFDPETIEIETPKRPSTE